MPRKVLLGLAGATLWLASSVANAIELFVDPAIQSVGLGNTVSVDVNIGDLGSGVAPSIGAFDIDVNFDASLLDPIAVAFGDGLNLGDPLDSFTGFSLTDPVNVFEVSLIFPDSTLDGQQPDAFTLFTLTFDTLAAGVSAIDLSVIELGDALGIPLLANVTGGEITIEAPSGVAAPPILSLMALGLIGLSFRPRRPSKPA